jgi:hypothetical protein
MACIEKIYSVSALTGNGKCNANCAGCAGKYLREEAKESSLYYRNLEAAIKLSARYGGWSFSLTSAGEPTCDPDAVTHALEVYAKCANQGAYFPNVNLFSNGIIIGKDQNFCKEYLPRWKSLGLTNIAISFHSAYGTKQADVYGIPLYPFFPDIRNNILEYGIGMRATLLLRKGIVDNAKRYEEAIERLINFNIDNITSWPIGNPDGTSNEYTPSIWGIWDIKLWLRKNARLCHGHVWGGGVYDYHGNILRITDYVTKHNPRSEHVRQLVVFQDGTVSYSWIREGALCMK